MPATLSLSTNYEETVAFLLTVRKVLSDRWLLWEENPRLRNYATTQNRKGVKLRFDKYWDFSQIKEITSDVALLIAAEFDVSMSSLGLHGVTGAIEIEKWDPRVVTLLYGVGYFELTKVDPPGSCILSGEDFRILRFKSGSVADGSYVKELLLELGMQELIDNPDVFCAIAEAITNTKHHAYRDHNLAKPMKEDWWMTGVIFPKERRVSISVWDRGRTIPATLPSWDRYPKFQRGFRRFLGRVEDMTASDYDGAAIQLAMAAGRSSTLLPQRGKGLPLIESIVDLCASGSMSIHSRRGTFVRVKGEKPRSFNRNSDIGGTLITWDWQFHGT